MMVVSSWMMMMSLLGALSWAQSNGAVDVDASMILKVQRPQETADALIAKARQNGGYFASRSNQQVRFKIPVAQVDAFIEHIAKQGELIGRDFNSSGLTAAIAETSARLKAREEVLARYFEVLQSASPEAVVTVEREITSLVQQIEELKGRLRYLNHQAQYADVDVRFQFRDRAAPARDGSSSFPWLNTINLPDLVGAFHND